MTLRGGRKLRRSTMFVLASSGLVLAALLLAGGGLELGAGPASVWHGGRIEQVARLAGYEPAPMVAAGNFVYIGDGTILTVVDVANPVDPQRIGFLALPTLPEDLAIDQDRIVAAAGVAGVFVVDASEPARPKMVGHWPAPARATKVLLRGDRALVLTGEVDPNASDGAATLHVIDLSDPRAPQLIGAVEVPGMAEDMVMAADTVYIIARRDDEESLWAFELSEEGTLRALGGRGLDIDPPGYSPHIAVTEDFVIVASGAASAGLVVVDVHEPARMTVVGRQSPPDAVSTAHDVAVVDQSAYVLCDGSLCVYDLYNPARPRLSAHFEAVWGTRLAPVAQGLALVGPENLFLVDTRLASRPKVLGTMARFRVADGQVYLSDQHLFVTDGATLWVYDVASPTTPRPIAHVDLAAHGDLGGEFATASTLMVHNNLMYIGMEVGWGGALSVVDIGNPAEPQVVLPANESTVDHEPVAMAAYGDYLYVYGIYGELVTGSSLVVLDISNPAAPRKVKDLEPAGEPAVVDDHLLLADDRGLVVFDLADPLSPREISRIALSGLRDLHVVAPYAYGLAGTVGSQFVVMDLTDIARPRVVGRLGGVCDRLQSVASTLAYCGWGRNGMQVVDLSRPDWPRSIPSGAWPSADLRDATEIQSIHGVGDMLAIGLRYDGAALLRVVP